MANRYLVIDCEQRSPEWFKARAGILTATGAADMLAKPLKSGGEPAVKRDLRVRLAVERITGIPEDGNGFVNAAMQRGIDLEAEARAAYEAATGTLVQEVGFVRHAELPIGCSPDGLIGDGEGGVEIKCPKTATQIGYLEGRRVPPEYVPQITHTLFVTGAPWWDFVSYDPRLPEPGHLFIIRAHAKDFDLDAYAATLQAFLVEVDAEFARITAVLESLKESPVCPA